MLQSEETIELGFELRSEILPRPYLVPSYHQSSVCIPRPLVPGCLFCYKRFCPRQPSGVHKSPCVRHSCNMWPRLKIEDGEEILLSEGKEDITGETSIKCLQPHTRVQAKFLEALSSSSPFFLILLFRPSPPALSHLLFHQYYPYCLPILPTD
jgi:hypothetical protein